MLSERLLRRDRRSLPLHWRATGVVAAVLLCLSVVVVTSGQTSQTVVASLPELQTGTPIDGELASGQFNRFRFELTKGDFVHVVVEQHGVDVQVTLFRPDHSNFWGTDEANDLFMRENLVGIADATGTWIVDVRPAYPDRAPGRYAIRLEAARPAVAQDQTRIDAERAFARGRGLGATGNFSDYPKAIDQYKTAAETFRTIGDRAGVLKCLLERGVLEWAVSSPDTLDTNRAAEQLALELHDDVSRAKAIHFAGL